MSDGNRNSAHAFTEVEEEFFRAGSALSQPQPVETFNDLDDGYRPTPLLRRLFARKASHH
jgi:hypothetical protein